MLVPFGALTVLAGLELAEPVGVLRPHEYRDGA
jgi:hypothetical protein